MSRLREPRGARWLPAPLALALALLLSLPPPALGEGGAHADVGRLRHALGTDEDVDGKSSKGHKVRYHIFVKPAAAMEKQQLLEDALKKEYPGRVAKFRKKLAKEEREAQESHALLLFGTTKELRETADRVVSALGGLPRQDQVDPSVEAIVARCAAAKLRCFPQRGLNGEGAEEDLRGARNMPPSRTDSGFIVQLVSALHPDSYKVVIWVGDRSAYAALGQEKQQPGPLFAEQDWDGVVPKEKTYMAFELRLASWTGDEDGSDSAANGSVSGKATGAQALGPPPDGPSWFHVCSVLAGCLILAAGLSICAWLIVSRRCCLKEPPTPIVSRYATGSQYLAEAVDGSDGRTLVERLRSQRRWEAKLAEEDNNENSRSSEESSCHEEGIELLGSISVERSVRPGFTDGTD